MQNRCVRFGSASRNQTNRSHERRFPIDLLGDPHPSSIAVCPAGSSGVVASVMRYISDGASPTLKPPTANPLKSNRRQLTCTLHAQVDIQTALDNCQISLGHHASHCPGNAWPSELISPSRPRRRLFRPVMQPRGPAPSRHRYQVLLGFRCCARVSVPPSHHRCDCETSTCCSVTLLIASKENT